MNPFHMATFRSQRVATRRNFDFSQAKHRSIFHRTFGATKVAVFLVLFIARETAKTFGTRLMRH